MKHLRTAAAIAAASVVLLALAGPASAAPAEIEHWTEHNEWLHETPSDFCPGIGFDVLEVEDASGTARTVERRGETYWATTVRSETSWTNMETGKSFTSVFQGQDKDLWALTNDDDTLSLKILIAGPTQYYDADGNKLFKDVGRQFISVVIDSEGNWIEDTVSFDMKGNFETMGRDFCADLVEFTS